MFWKLKRPFFLANQSSEECIVRPAVVLKAKEIGYNIILCFLNYKCDIKFNSFYISVRHSIKISISVSVKVVFVFLSHLMLSVCWDFCHWNAYNNFDLFLCCGCLSVAMIDDLHVLV